MKTKFYFSLGLCLTIVLHVTAQTQLWGTSYSGGANGEGAIFSADGNGNGFHIEFSMVNATGANPNGSPVLAGNNKLYGVTETGGFGDSCVVYSYEPLTGTFTNIHDLYQYTQFGWEAKSEMLRASNGMLYGLCAAGGANGGGVIYKVDPFTDTYTDMYDFSSYNGSSPFGSLIQLPDGNLYGMAQYGGASSYGVIFSFDPEAAVYTKLYMFDGNSGANPTFGKLLYASNGKIYGTTQSGGVSYYGVLFSFDINTGVYTKLHDFDGVHGNMPNGSLMEATNGKLYGTTYQGGLNSQGILFSFDITSGTYTDVFDFNGTNGSNPKRGVTQGSNGKIYGTTFSGGVNNAGVAFSYDIITGTYTKLSDFNMTSTGAGPDCEIVETPVLTSVGIASINTTPEIKIGPNPVHDYINLSGSDKDDVILFTDVMGKELASVKMSQFSKSTMDVSNFPQVFFVRGQHTNVKKVVRQ
jgi:uncharacterized repeat protein (TIGR03803 family)